MSILRFTGCYFHFIQFLRPDVCLGKFVGAVNISVAMNLEDLGISRDLEILAQTPQKLLKKKGCWNWGSSRLRSGSVADRTKEKLSEITFDPQTGPWQSSSKVSNPQGKIRKRKLQKYKTDVLLIALLILSVLSFSRLRKKWWEWFQIRLSKRGEAALTLKGKSSMHVFSQLCFVFVFHPSVAAQYCD